MIVRQATVADLDLLAPLFDSYRQFYRNAPDLDRARRFLLERFRRNESIIFLALEDDGIAVGFTQLFPSFSSGSTAPVLILNDLFVAPKCRRQKVGSSLLDAVASHARTVGAVRLTLSTEVTNQGARALYEEAGWKLQTDFCVYNLSIA